MKIKTRLALLSFMLLSAFGVAQTQISGSVVSEDGSPIPGVNVVVQGTNNGATTDFDGNFSISASSGDVLSVSYVGFVTQAITIEDQTTLSITLQESFDQLDEIVVTGYGSRKRSSLTGAIAKIGGDDIASIQATRADDALAGKLAGVFIQNQNGEPGADPKIQIRAASSISGDSNPLVVVDGYPISGSLVTVNPNDIQSLEVLKDASSAAIYGSRGANGVILVTTKKRENRKTII